MPAIHPFYRLIGMTLTVMPVDAHMVSLNWSNRHRHADRTIESLVYGQPALPEFHPTRIQCPTPTQIRVCRQIFENILENSDDMPAFWRWVSFNIKRSNIKFSKRIIHKPKCMLLDSILDPKHENKILILNHQPSRLHKSFANNNFPRVKCHLLLPSIAIANVTCYEIATASKQ